MSKNRELLNQIKRSVDNNPEILKDISVEDIVGTICFELNEIRQFYPPTQYAEIQDRILNNAELMLRHTDAREYSEAAKIFDYLVSLHDMLPDIELTLPFIENANYDRALNRHVMEGTIIAMGDSHSCFFSGNENLTLIPIKNDMSTCNQVNGLPFTVLHLGPCLAYNSDQYGSTNRLREKVEWLDEHFLCQNDTIIFSLGEIDVRTQIYKRADNNTYKSAVDDVLEHYKALLLWLKERGYTVICYGPIGSLKDDAPLDDYRPRVGNEIQRNLAGRYYNEQLKKFCDENEMGFFTLFYDMVDDENRTDIRFLAEDQFHLGQYGFSKAADKLSMLGIYFK